MHTALTCLELVARLNQVDANMRGMVRQYGIGEQELSTPELARIAIARALITNPRILIFDEATSSLDYESERIIHDNLARIRKGRTVIIIAHRLSAVRDCDAIIALDKGRIVEGGTHSELLSRNGYYAHLHSQQGGAGNVALAR
jgi:subfamily B ATP-binding cassette protein HlyB/CyaB